MSAYLVLSPYDIEDDIAPHPELVKAQRPTTAQVTEAAAMLGLFAEGSYLSGQALLAPVPSAHGET